MAEKATHALCLSSVLLVTVCTGCMSLGASNITTERLDRGLVVFVEDCAHGGDRGFEAFQDGMGNRGMSVALEHFNWSPRLSQMSRYGLPDRTDSGEAGIDLARSLRHYAITYPGRPLHVVAHGHGDIPRT